MKVVQLGCGITGLVCAEELSKNGAVDGVVLADMDTGPAMALKARIDSEKLSVAKVDGTRVSEIRGVLGGADLVVSSMPWGLNLKVLETAARMGVDYVDFSMVAPTVSQFRSVSRMCREGDITALTSAGEDPGISDCFARFAASKLDSVSEAHVFDGDSGSVEGLEIFSLWSPVDLIWETTVPAAVFVNGRMTYVPPLHEREVYEFPPPVGPLPVYKTVHEETFLMPRYIKGVRNASFRIAIDDSFAHFARTMRKLGLHSEYPVNVKGVLVRPLDVVAAMLPRPVDLAGKVKGTACIVVEVLGVKNGAKRLVKIWTMMSHERAFELCGSNATGYLVGIGGAVAAEMILAGEFSKKGLFVPEHLPPVRFVERLIDKGLKVKQQVREL
jgi:saccharopine dehydrogenase-like NADP-dependent oxidoreductase